jgi:predicted metalloprotease
MRWERGGRSSNLEDRRGSSPAMMGGGFGKMGLGGIVLILIIAAVTKQNPLALIGALDGGAGTAVTAPVDDPAEEEKVEFMSFVLDDAQALWNQALPESFRTAYRDARLVLFRNSVSSACGQAGSATGPFYCPGDEQVYIDLSFFDELARRFGAPGDFAEAYVLAHEIGHHVQTVLGTNREVSNLQRQRPDMANRLSVRLELQADCYAGIWAASAARAGRLEAGDLEEGLAAAAAVGDDRLQKAATGTVQPETFTHGTSAERVSWFRRGFNTGDPRQCDTFQG